MSIEPYPNWQFGSIDDLDRVFGHSSVLTRTQTRSGSPKQFLTLDITMFLISISRWVPIDEKNCMQIDRDFIWGTECYLSDRIVQIVVEAKILQITSHTWYSPRLSCVFNPLHNIFYWADRIVTRENRSHWFIHIKQWHGFCQHWKSNKSDYWTIWSTSSREHPMGE